MLFFYSETTEGKCIPPVRIAKHPSGEEQHMDRSLKRTTGTITDQTYHKTDTSGNPPMAVKPWAEILFHLILGSFALFCVLPLIITVIISFTSKESILKNGYSFFPSEWSLDAYEYTAKLGKAIAPAFGNSALVTVLGTLLAMTVTCLYSYVLSRKDFCFRKFFTWWCFFPMLFSGGIAPTYVVVRHLLGLQNSYAAIIIPMLLSTGNIILLKIFFRQYIPDELYDAASIDGCGEWRKLRNIALPLAKPGIATVALFTAFGYWNEWFIPMLYVRDPEHRVVSQVLIDIQRNADMLVRPIMSEDMMPSQKIQRIPFSSIRFALCFLFVLPPFLVCFAFGRYLLPGVRVGRIKE